MSTRQDCPTCPSRDVTDTHIGRCRFVTTERTSAEQYGATQGIPAVATADAWAHLGHVATPQDATRIIRQIVDLGWRPVIGKDPGRLWTGGDDRG
ncbi:hypothetical protein [Nocardioides sp. BYT-33-1]|uniref:hypothetical protein n=1 Tax=Nocardioides sp. BYT-33-1 TaxID=3416952 RepID=UPI003F53D3FD